MKKKKKAANRAQASFKNSRTHSEKIDRYRYDKKPSVIMKDSASNPSRADAELKRLMRGDVFRSADKTVKQSNSSNRRYK